MSDTATGILLLVIAGIMNANFTLPLKFTRRWAWEHTWLAWTILALLLLPPIVAYFMVPDLGDVYVQVGFGAVFVVCCCGLGWGLSQVFFGLAVQSVGVALTFAITLGVSALFGGLVDLLTKHKDKIHSQTGTTIIAGLVLVLAGVALCAVAGRKREMAQGMAPGARSFAQGFLFCIIAGIGSALVGLGLAWGTPIVRAAKSTDTPEIWRALAVWLPLMVAGAIPNLLYCVHLVRKHGTWSRFKEPGFIPNVILAVVMAVFWFGSTLFYGISVSYIGSLGGAIAWPMYMSLIVIAASVGGLLTGEWRNSGATPIRYQLAGVVILIAAAAVLSRGI